MKLLLILPALLLSLPSVAQESQQVRPVREQAVRCATLYLAMSKVPAVASRQPMYNRLIDDLEALAKRDGASDSEIVDWGKGYVAELAKGVGSGNSFIPEQGKLCQAFVDQHLASSKSGA